MQLSKQQLGELIIARNKLVTKLDDTAPIQDVVTTLDGIIVAAISANLGAGENCINHLYH